MVGLIAIAVVSASRIGTAAEPAGLRCEYLVNPINIDSTKPRLSWEIDGGYRGWMESGYQILVASSKAELGQNHGDLWDSGKVESNESTQIEYRGKALASREACFWKVRSWDAKGVATSWSKPNLWEMGLLGDPDWQGSTWIGRKAPAGENPAPYLRKSFNVASHVLRARIYACGLGYAEISVNGKMVSPGVERDPGYTDFSKRVLYVAYDVTKLVKRGSNVLGAVLGTGWYDVHDKATWNFDRARWRGRPRLRLLLVIDSPDGKTQFVGSDSSWKVTTGPVLRDGIYTGEIYDAQKEISGWDKPEFDDRTWVSVDDLGAPQGHLAARACPPVSVTKSIKPVAIMEPKPGVAIVDFGQNFSGHVRLHVNEPAGTKITLRYSERVGKDGMIDRSQIEQFMAKANPPQPFQSDTYVCKGGGDEVWEQRFSYSGFRYAEVTGFPAKPVLSNFEGRFAHTDFESAGDFECSSPLFNQIQKATRYSYLSNAQSIPTDCPQREKNGWTGDAQLAAEAGLMNYRSATFYTKWLDDFSDNERPDGKVSVIVPTGGWGMGGRNPAWDSAYPIVAYDLYLYGGDSRVLSKHYDKLCTYVDSLATEMKDGVLTFDSLGDWVPWDTQTPSQFSSTIYLFADAQMLAKISKILGKPEGAEKYSKLADQVKAGIEAKFFDSEKQTYSNGSQTALSMALYFGVVPESRRAAILDQLIQNVTKQGHLDTGILGAKYVLRVLSESGRTKLAYDIVSRKEQPGWGWWFSQGATTLWEDWKGESSLNHIMFGDVSNWMIQWVAGIGLNSSAPGFSDITIQPVIGSGLSWARATHESPYGLIVSSWHKDSKGLYLDVKIPANATATVQLKVPPQVKVTEGGLPVAKVDGVTSFVQKPDETDIRIGSGTYHFFAAMPKGEKR